MYHLLTPATPLLPTTEYANSVDDTTPFPLRIEVAAHVSRTRRVVADWELYEDTMEALIANITTLWREGCVPTHVLGIKVPARV